LFDVARSLKDMEPSYTAAELLERMVNCIYNIFRRGSIGGDEGEALLKKGCLRREDEFTGKIGDSPSFVNNVNIRSFSNRRLPS